MRMFFLLTYSAKAVFTCWINSYMLVEAHLKKSAEKKKQPGVNFPLPLFFPPFIMPNDLNIHFITLPQLKAAFAAFPKRSHFAERYVVSAVISYTSFSKRKAYCCLSPEREDAPRCALHHFRLADETAQGAFHLCMC